MQLSRKSGFALACMALALAATAAPQSAAMPASSWRLSPGGYGPFKIGMNFAQVRKLAPRLRRIDEVYAGRWAEIQLMEECS